jgi:leucyl/phenylalanyl-tRNA---protein transferase
LYGVSIGNAFFGESMFSRQSNASKLALYALVQICLHRSIRFIDCQFHTNHLARFGAREIPRGEYLQLLLESQRTPAPPTTWTADSRIFPVTATQVRGR